MMTYVRFYIALMIAAVAMMVPQDAQGMDFPYGLKRLASNESFNPRPLKKIKEGEGEMECDAPQPYFEVTIKGKNLITSSPKISNLTVLRVLDFSAHNLTTIPSEIFNLITLTQLDFSDNKLSTISPKIGSLTALIKLDLSENKLTILPSALFNLTGLRVLNFFNNKLIALPSRIGNLTVLRVLDLCDNKLITFPQEIGSLTALTKLNLSWNNLTTLPPEIGNITGLKALDLSFNGLKEPETKWAKHMSDIENSSGLNNCRLFYAARYNLPIKIQMVLLANQYDPASFLATLFPDVIKLVCRLFLDQHYLSESQETLN